jgi:L-ribulose-5-phosphate 3-epimerase
MQQMISRRQMLAYSAKALAVCSLLAGCTKAVTDQRKSAGFEIGICDWTIGKRTNPASLPLAKKIGIDGVQVDFGSPKADSLPLFDAGLQNQFLKTAEKNDVAICSLAMGTLNEYPLKSDSRTEKWVSDAIDIAAAMETNVILLAFFGNGDLRDDSKGKDNVVSKLKNLAPKAERASVTFGIESWLSAPQHLEIIDRISSPAVKVYYDVGNSHKRGYDIYQEIRDLKGQICEFHAKDYDDLYGKGSIDFVKVRDAMDAIGYRGWIVMEGTEMPLGLEESCRYDAAYLRKVFTI